MNGTTALATFAGGCFWCLEAVYRRVRGVQAVTSGYMGGQTEHPSYEAVCSGDTGHAEVVQIEFDPQQVSYRELLEIFFAIHDPTQLNRQGNDVGTQYRSAVFWHDEAQRDEALAMIEALTRAGAYTAPIVTEVAPASTFWPAEAYHQDYYARHPHQPYCLFVVAPKVMKFESRFAHLRKP
ncbi:MAG: peptide-methionine (S)-S-oxide reductase MsrA [Thiobacillaceae bacterium]|nr:peptide-methionine (S)-S-oxide reductase MsrA [Thiobacillaceae bacterium]MDW8322940.1 peptide-methionine (S)-S-oxide reductase MsrA [Burkholderiales bacterium]